MTGIIHGLLVILVAISREVARQVTGFLDRVALLIYDFAITFQEAHLQPGDIEE